MNSHRDATRLFAIAGYIFLLQNFVPLDGLNAPAPVGLNVHTAGTMLAFATCSSVVTYFVTRTAGELKQRERQLLRTQAAQAASRRYDIRTHSSSTRRQ